MPRQATVHFNPPDRERNERLGRARCGQPLRRVEWRTDLNDVTCNNCRRYAESDNKTTS